jgi:glucokinase
VGHLVVESGGRPCTCGQRGCLEAYANAAALVDFAGGGYRDAEQVIAAARSGEDRARAAIRTLAGWLARGSAHVIHLLDPELLVIGGGLAEDNPMLFDDLRRGLAGTVMTWERRALRVEPSPLGYLAGVMGAAAVGLG